MLPARVPPSSLQRLWPAGGVAFVLLAMLVLLSGSLSSAAPLSPSLPTSASFYAIGCRAGGRIAVAGTHGIVAVTHDGGATWHSTSAATAGAVLTDIQFIDDAHLVAAGVLSGTRGQQDGLLVRSEDGGLTWSALGMPSGLTRVRFSTTGAGYALTTAGAVLRSADGGDTWEQTAPLTGGFSARSAALAIADPQTILAATVRGVAYSDNGGSAWRVLSPPDLGAWLGAWTDAQGYAWLVGEDGLARADHRGDSWRVRTTWPGMRAVAAHYASGGDFYVLAVTTGMGSHTPQPVLLRSSDGAMTWQRETSPADALARAGRAGQHATGLCVAEAEAVYLLGERGAVLRSHDGGAAWSPVERQPLAP